MIISSAESPENLSQERHLDQTFYVDTATNNFKLLSNSGHQIEGGSSHREKGNRGKFNTTGGQSVTFCCSVISGTLLDLHRSYEDHSVRFNQDPRARHNDGWGRPLGACQANTGQ
mgnify:CR=1 FL=1